MRIRQGQVWKRHRMSVATEVLRAAETASLAQHRF